MDSDLLGPTSHPLNPLAAKMTSIAEAALVAEAPPAPVPTDAIVDAWWADQQAFLGPRVGVEVHNALLFAREDLKKRLAAKPAAPAAPAAPSTS